MASWLMLWWKEKYVGFSFFLIVPLALEIKLWNHENVEAVKFSTRIPVPHVYLLMCSVLAQVLLKTCLTADMKPKQTTTNLCFSHS